MKKRIISVILFFCFAIGFANEIEDVAGVKLRSTAVECLTSATKGNWQQSSAFNRVKGMYYKYGVDVYYMDFVPKTNMKYLGYNVTSLKVLFAGWGDMNEVKLFKIFVSLDAPLEDSHSIMNKVLSKLPKMNYDDVKYFPEYLEYSHHKDDLYVYFYVLDYEIVLSCYDDGIYIGK